MKIINILFALTAIAVFTVTVSFAADRHLETEEVADASGITGVFRLILYGGRHIDDIETVAILDKEGDEYTFEPYAPEYDYKIKEGLPDRKALDEAEEFVSWHDSFYRSQLSRILDDSGGVIGYEVRPLYQPLTFGVADVLDVDYWLRDGKVIVTIGLIPSVEEDLFDGDDREDRIK